MSHPQQRNFCKQVKRMYPEHFHRVRVADVGSLDINGNNRGLFRRSTYIGIDIVDGKNVDVVGEAHWVLPTLRTIGFRVTDLFDTIISTEALEHDQHWRNTLLAMYERLKPGGMLLITAAGVGRAEHGTNNHRPQDSPGTTEYYRNISNEMFASVLSPSMFDAYCLKQDKSNCDIQFYGIKKLVNGTGP